MSKRETKGEKELEPVESDREMTVAPREITLSAVNWATFPAPEIATRVWGEVRVCSGAAFAII